MGHYSITNTASGAFLGVFAADDEDGAIRAMHRDAGWTIADEPPETTMGWLRSSPTWLDDLHDVDDDVLVTVRDDGSVALATDAMSVLVYSSDVDSEWCRWLTEQGCDIDLEELFEDLRVEDAEGECACCGRDGLVVPSEGQLGNCWDGDDTELVADPDYHGGDVTCQECHDLHDYVAMLEDGGVFERHTDGTKALWVEVRDGKLHLCDANSGVETSPETIKAEVAEWRRCVMDVGPRCVYCGEHQDEDTVPDEDDDEAWAEVARTHGTQCEWVLTRAHSRNTDHAE